MLNINKETSLPWLHNAINSLEWMVAKRSDFGPNLWGKSWVARFMSISLRSLLFRFRPSAPKHIDTPRICDNSQFELTRKIRLLNDEKRSFRNFAIVAGNLLLASLSSHKE